MFPVSSIEKPGIIGGELRILIEMAACLVLLSFEKAADSIEKFAVSTAAARPSPCDRSTQTPTGT